MPYLMLTIALLSVASQLFFCVISPPGRRLQWVPAALLATCWSIAEFQRLSCN